MKMNVAVILGGMSTEHEVSKISGTAVLKNLNKEKYNIYPIYMSQEGNWFKYTKIKEEMKLGEKLENLEEIKDIWNYLKQMDVVFPVLHGLYGEDGTIQGMLELLKIPYVGPKVLGSAVGMDKVYTKIIFEKAQIPQAKYVYVRKYNDKFIYIDDNFNEKKCDGKELVKLVEQKIKYPMFVKPSNSGSSVGINKAKNAEELEKFINYAAQFDKKIVIEETLIGKEIECAVLGNEDVKASILGEIKPAEEFYSFSAKYSNAESKTEMPADIPEELTEKVKKYAIKAYKAIDGKGLSRVDFFVNPKTKEIFINEINTLPGFTQISMYPKLWEKSGISYSDLLDKLIELAING